jgi:hypothetical protein
VPSASQNKNDKSALYGALLRACQSVAGRRNLKVNRSIQDGIYNSASWLKSMKQMRMDFRIKKVENVMTAAFR